jgi:4-amino-4-deoxy-L-arabinose transferase-like glycosyltransferase
VRQLFQKLWSWELLPVVPLVLLSLYRTLSHPVWLVLSGRGLPRSQDSDWYLNYAQGLLTNFSIQMNIDEILYLGYNLLLAGLLALFRDPVAIVYAQALVASLAIVLVYQIGRILFNKRTGVIAGLFYLYNWDVTLWSTYVLSDSFFVSLLILCVYLLVRAVDSRRKTDIALFAVAATYLLFFRPTGVVVAAVILLHILVQLGQERLWRVWLRYRHPISVVVALLVFLVGAGFAGHFFDGFIDSLQYNVKLVIYNVYAKGQIYDIPTAYDYFYRPNYSIDKLNSLSLSFIINNWDSVSVLYIRRTFAFLGVWAWMTPLRTTADYLFYLYKLLPAILFAAGTVAAIRAGTFGRAAVLWGITLAVFAFCILLFIDAMYRYRFPAMPFIGIIAAYGLDRIINGGRILAAKTWSRAA